MRVEQETAEPAPRAAEGADGPRPPAEKQMIKCVVWDLDNTLWDGVLLEDAQVALRAEAAEVIKTLDARGILHSVASKNDHDLAMGKLREFGLDEFFLYPQINWNSKVSSVSQIARLLNIGLDAVAFVDDQPSELAEVSFSLPQVFCHDAAQAGALLEMPSLQPRFVTEDSKARRLMYLADIERGSAEEEFVGSKEEFLASLGMVFTIARASEADLVRAEELTLRTNQLNTTGRTYSYDELDGLRRSDRHRLYVTSLRDRFGDYGKIGLALVECDERAWTIRLLLMSCRVMTRGVGTVLLNHIMREAREAGAVLRADFVENDRNRMMYVTYKFAGFAETAREGRASVLESDLSRIQPPPHYLTLELLD